MSCTISACADCWPFKYGTVKLSCILATRMRAWRQCSELSLILAAFVAQENPESVVCSSEKPRSCGNHLVSQHALLHALTQSLLL